jgi:hypothetical protein
MTFDRSRTHVGLPHRASYADQDPNADIVRGNQGKPHHRISKLVAESSRRAYGGVLWRRL